MKKQSIIMRIIVVFFSLLFCAFAFLTTVGGMLADSTQNILTAEFWVDVLTDDTMPIGGIASSCSVFLLMAAVASS